MSGTTVPHIEARGVTRRHAGASGTPIVALEPTSLVVARGTLVVLTGRSGCGKTSLLRLIGALDRPTAGDVLHEGQALSALSEPELAVLRRGIGLVFQEPVLLPRLPLWENVAYPLIPRGVPRAERRTRACEVLERLGVGALAQERPEGLSGGEKQRAATARALVGGPSLVIADEPTAHLDAASAELVLGEFARLRARGVTLVIASHRDDLGSCADQVVELERG